jgi:hypothetical protein
MKRYFIISLLLAVAALETSAQDAVDALRYSRINIGGTARYMGMSGAFGALGADFTLASTNPAGIGLYKSSELSVTPSVFIGTTESQYNGTSANDSRANFAMGNVGFVIASKLDPRTSPGWKYVQFASGINRLADFNNHTIITGNNSSNSLIDSYAAFATDNNLSIEDIEGNANNGYTGMYAYDLNLAWWTYLLNPVIGGGYAGYIPPDQVKLQTKTIDSHGSMNEYTFSFAANYLDRLYIGTTFGLPFIRYYEYSTYSEDDINNTIKDFNYFTRVEDLETHGNGFNFKIGLIYRVNDWFRVGAAFHSPSWFTNMNDHWTATMVADYEIPDTGGYTRYSVTNSGSYEYDLTTPLRVQGNLAFIIGNIGLVSADYEFVDYSSAHLSAYDYSFTNENQAISNSYRGAHNIRVGTEWRYNIFSFRAGVRYETSPYDNNINDGSLLGFSGGLGLRQGPFFMDLAYAYTGKTEDYYLYNSSGVSTNPSQNTTRTHTILTTFGLKF